jgi:hypothetical protein
MANLVFLGQHGRTGLFHAALRADDADQVRAAEFELVRLADVVQFLQVFAGHGGILANGSRFRKSFFDFRRDVLRKMRFFQLSFVATRKLGGGNDAKIRYTASSNFKEPSRMRIAMLFLMVLAVVPSAARCEDGGNKPTEDPVRAVLGRLGKMEPAEQRAFLQQQESRTEKAAKVLYTSPNVVARQVDRIHDMLHQKTVTWQVLYDVISNVNTLENRAIEKQAKKYQEVVFETFHPEVKDYGQRQQAWIDVQESWKQAGSRFEQQGQVLDWLDAAIRAATPKTAGPIPEKPKF